MHLFCEVLTVVFSVLLGIFAERVVLDFEATKLQDTKERLSSFSAKFRNPIICLILIAFITLALFGQDRFTDETKNFSNAQKMIEDWKNSYHDLSVTNQSLLEAQKIERDRFSDLTVKLNQKVQKKVEEAVDKEIEKRFKGFPSETK